LATKTSGPLPRANGGVGGRTLRVARLPVTSDLNPYQSLLYEHLAYEGIEFAGNGDVGPRWLIKHRGEVDILHFHWCLHRLGEPDGVYREVPADAMTDDQLALARRRLATGVRRARELDYRVAWTVHEPWHLVEGHDFHRWSGALLAQHCDAIFVHDLEAAEVVRELEPAVEPTLVPVCHFGGFYPEGRSREEVRRELDIGADAFVFLAFGAMREDKELPGLLDAFGEVSGPAVLVVAGPPSERRTAASLARRAPRDPRVRFLPRRIPREQVAELFGASDCAVLARRKMWTSGSLALAMTLGCPVVAVDRPLVRGLVGDTGWYFDLDGPRSLSRAMGEALDAGTAEARSRGDAARQLMATGHEWSELAAITAAAMRRFVAQVPA
jgi:beta-1,4-mannosyltransferase